MSPRTRPPSHKEVRGPARRSQGEVFVIAEGQVEKRHRPKDEASPSSSRLNETIAQSDPPLDTNFVGQYLERCIAVAESQIAGARDKSRKKEAVKEIERLVEKVVARVQADGG